MTELKIKTPAKINLTLEVLNKLPNGFHNIQSIMQTINLYDFLTFKIKKNTENKIILSGNSTQIPYNKKNLVHKAISKYFEIAKIHNCEIEVYIEKNIPIEAGLAGGSTNASGTILALNHIFKVFNKIEIDKILSSLGSDLNFCFYGGTQLCEGRGEKLTKLETPNFEVSLIKPRNLGISAKKAYQKFDLIQHTFKNYTKQMLENLKNDTQNFLHNDLETAIINDYAELKEIKTKLPKSIMSGSGSTFFVLDGVVNAMFSENFQLIEGLETIKTGVEIL